MGVSWVELLFRFGAAGLSYIGNEGSKKETRNEKGLRRECGMRVREKSGGGEKRMRKGYDIVRASVRPSAFRRVRYVDD